MKHYIFLFAIILGSCKTTNLSSEPTRHYLSVHLIESASGSDLQKTYEVDGIESIRPNNRTKNIYACQFMKDQKALDELLEKMKKDAKIISVETSEINTSLPTNSTNSKKAKAQPGKN